MTTALEPAKEEEENNINILYEELGTQERNINM